MPTYTLKKMWKNLATYESGGRKTVIDHILVRKKVKNLKATPGEETMTQRRSIVIGILFKKACRERKLKPNGVKIWRLKERAMQRALRDKAGNAFTKDFKWDKINSRMATFIKEVSGMSKSTERKETWRWNGDAVKKAQKRIINNAAMREVKKQ